MFPRFQSAGPVFALLAAVLPSVGAGAQNMITTVAGGGTYAFPRRPIPALAAPLGIVQSVAVDPAGNVYVADDSNHLILRITPERILSVAAGNGSFGPATDGTPATGTSLGALAGVAADGAGNVYVSEGSAAGDGGDRILKVSPDGRIAAYAGCGAAGFGGDGGPATQAWINRARGLHVDVRGNLFIADTGNNRIRKVNPQGVIATVAGNGNCCDQGDNVPALSASLNSPYGVFVDPDGVIYIADTFNGRVRRVGADGIITTVAGTRRGYGGDRGPANQAMLDWPTGVAVDGEGTLYIADSGNNRVRKVAPNGIITTVAGRGAPGYSGDGGPAIDALLERPGGLAADAAGNLYVTDSLRVRKIDTRGIITTIAGSGGPPAGVTFNSVTDIDIDRFGNLYVVDALGGRVYKLSPAGVIGSLASFTGFPTAATVGPDDSLYVSVQALSLARRDGGVTRIAPDGARTSAAHSMINPGQAAVDAQGAVYVTDWCYGMSDGCDNTVLKVIDGVKTVFAGTGEAGFGGDGGPAIAALLNRPGAVRFGASGNLYVVDALNNRIRKIFMNPASGLPEPSMTLHLQLLDARLNALRTVP